MKELSHLTVRAFVYFGYNYTEPKEFIKWICRRCNKMHIYIHLLNKFYHLSKEFGGYAVMGMFYTELDADLRNALVDYVMEVWLKDGHLSLKDNEKKTLEQYENL